MTKLARTPLLLASVAALLLASSSFAAAIGTGGCVVNNQPTLSITPPGCTYSGPGSLTHGSNFNPDLGWSGAIHQGFTNVQVAPGGILQGSIERFGSTVTVTVTGKGRFAGFERTISVPANCEAHSGPFNPEDPFISFPTEMMRIEGQLVGDRDFESLRIVGGRANGFPSPGRVTAADQGNGTHVVDSMFDIGFHIEYVGARGGALEGLSGSFEGVATMKAFATPTAQTTTK